MEIIYLLIGWLLGLFSPLITDKVKKNYTKKELLSGIQTELREAQNRLVALAYLLGSSCGKFDKDFLKWCLDYFNKNKEKKYKEAIDKLLELKDEELTKLIKVKRDNEKGISLSLKKYYLPFLESKIGEISLFNVELQNSFFEIKSKIESLNEHVDSTLKLQLMTFDSSLSIDNFARVTKQINSDYIFMQNIVIDLVNKIEKILVTKI